MQATPSSRRIPLDVAHQILATFGITEPTQVYERWVKPDGFDRDDLWTVVAESRFVFIVDWRAVLEEELGPIAQAVGELGAHLDVHMDDDGNEGWITFGDRCAQVKYVPSDDDDFTDVISAVQQVVPATIEFRASPSNGLNDGWVFAALAGEEWVALEALDADFIAAFFQPMTRLGEQPS